jgi:hypothetical protein
MRHTRSFVTIFNFQVNAQQMVNIVMWFVSSPGPKVYVRNCHHFASIQRNINNMYYLNYANILSNFTLYQTGATFLPQKCLF